MASVNGKSNNPKGKPKGVKNRRTVEWEKLGDFITEKGAKRVMDYLNDLKDDEEFYYKFERLLNYFKPKMQSSTIDHTTKGDKIVNEIDYTKLTDDDIKRLAEIQRKAGTY